MKFEFLLLVNFVIFLLAIYILYTSRLHLAKGFQIYEAASSVHTRHYAKYPIPAAPQSPGAGPGTVCDPARPFYRKRVQVGDPVDSEVTVVSMFFKLAKSKHSNEHYTNWMRNFFASATAAPLVLFTNWDSAGALLELGVRTSSPMTIYVFDSIWDVTRLIEAERGARVAYVSAYNSTQYAMDPEKRIHTPELYAIWNSKSYMMKLAATSSCNLYNSKYFIYTDMGAFRMGVFANWPDLSRVTQTGEALGDRVLFGRISESISAPRQNHIEGGFFMGTPRALDAYFVDFYAIHDQMLAENKFVGKDQTIMNTHVVFKFPNRSCTLWAPEFASKCINTQNIWFFYQFYFSHHHAESLRPGETHPACNASAGLLLAAENLITCNKVDKIAIPACYRCSFRPPPPPPKTTTLRTTTTTLTLRTTTKRP